MAKLILAQKGTAMLPILLPENAPDGFTTAAGELAHYLKRITGASFETKTDDGSVGIRLVIDETLAEEQFTLKTCGKGLTIKAGSLRGVFYGVYGLLEDVLGVRFYTHDVTVIPKMDELALEDLDVTDQPVLEYRQLDNILCMYPEWRAHNRVNGPDHIHVPAKRDGLNRFGGLKNYAIFVHTFNTLVSPDKYFDEHPEYFSMIDGVRIKERSQLCLTNPDVLAIAIDSVKTILREHPEATLISVSQNDWYNPCQCPECARVDEEEGSHAGTLIRFVNAIAEAIEPEFPKIVVDTLAYQYTRTPPKITKPRHNVCVRLCSIECCFGHPLETCDRVTGIFANNKDTSAHTFTEDLVGWGKICSRIYIWDYVTNYRHYWMPFPNFQVLGPNLRFFVKNGVRGVYEEGNYQSASPDLFELRSWLLAKLLWNPDFDEKQGIVEFTDAVYGEAAPEIRAYIQLLAKRVTEGNIHFGIFNDPDVEYLDDDTVKSAQTLMAAAQAKCLNLSQRVYVEKAALSVEYAAVCRDIYKGIIDAERIDAMIDKARTLGIVRINEWSDWNQLHDNLLNGKVGR